MKTIHDVYALLKDIADNHKDADHFPPSTPVINYFKMLDILNQHLTDAPSEYSGTQRRYDTFENERKSLETERQSLKIERKEFEHEREAFENERKAFENKCKKLEQERNRFQSQVEVLQKRITEVEAKAQEKSEKDSSISEKKMSELNHEIHELTREIGRLEKSHETLNLDYQKLKSRLDTKEDIIEELKSLLGRYEDLDSQEDCDPGFTLTEEEISDITDMESEKNEFRKVFDNIGFYCKCGWAGEDARFNPDITGSYQCPECNGPVYTKIKFKHEQGEQFEWGGKVWEYCRVGDPYPNEWIAIDKENGNVKAVIKPGSLKDKYHNCWIVKPASSELSVVEAG